MMPLLFVLVPRCWLDCDEPRDLSVARTRHNRKPDDTTKMASHGS